MSEETVQPEFMVELTDVKTGETVELPLRLDNKALFDLQQTIGKTVTELAVNPAIIGMVEVAHILRIGLQHTTNTRVTAKHIMEMMDDGRYAYYLKTATKALMSVLKANEKASDNSVDEDDDSDNPLALVADPIGSGNSEPLSESG